MAGSRLSDKRVVELMEACAADPAYRQVSVCVVGCGDAFIMRYWPVLRQLITNHQIKLWVADCQPLPDLIDEKVRSAEVAERMTEVRASCEAEGRDPSTLRFSLYVHDQEIREAGQARIDALARYAAVGLDRIVCFPARWSPTTEAQAAFAEDCRAAGIALAG